MNLTLITPPAREPITLEEARNHLRVDLDDDDPYIQGLIQAAREMAEAFTWRALITQTWELALDAWPEGDTIELPRPPLQSVDSIIYTDSDGNANTMPASDYIVDTRSVPGRIVLAPGASWPSESLRPASAIVVRFVAGYGKEPRDVPRAIRHAMLLLIGHWYEQREQVIVGAIPREIPVGFRALLWPYRALSWL